MIENREINEMVNNGIVLGYRAMISTNNHKIEIEINLFYTLSTAEVCLCGDYISVHFCE